MRPNTWAEWREWDGATDDLCERIEKGETYTAIAGSLGVAVSTVTRWVESDPQRSAHARASRMRTAVIWDERALQEIHEADDPFSLAKAKEAAHHYRWRASKINPKEYGDKLDVTAEIGVKALPDARLDEEIAKMSAKLGIASSMLMTQEGEKPAEL